MPSYKVRLEKADWKFEAEGDKTFVLEMIKRFAGDNIPGEGKIIKPASQAGSAKTGKPIGLGEFLRQLGLKKHTDLVLAIGYYLEKHDGMQSFSSGDVNKRYYDAKLEPSNTSQMITNNVQTGRIMPAKGDEGGRRKYVVTQSGEHEVEEWISATSKSK
jgi:hypothetical protein